MRPINRTIDERYTSGPLAWYEGTDLFDLGDVISEEVAHTIDVADLDGDQDVDVIAGFDGGKVVWFENDGDGTFDVEHHLQRVAPRTFRAANLDGDGASTSLWLRGTR